MTLPFAITDDVQESPIVNFLKHYQQCVFYKMSKIKKLENNKIICIKHNTNKADYLSVINATIEKGVDGVLVEMKKNVFAYIGNVEYLDNYELKVNDSIWKGDMFGTNSMSLFSDNFENSHITLSHSFGMFDDDSIPIQDYIDFLLLKERELKLKYFFENIFYKGIIAE